MITTGPHDILCRPPKHTPPHRRRQQTTVVMAHTPPVPLPLPAAPRKGCSHTHLLATPTATNPRGLQLPVPPAQLSQVLSHQGSELVRKRSPSGGRDLRVSSCRECVGTSPASEKSCWAPLPHPSFSPKVPPPILHLGPSPPQFLKSQKLFFNDPTLSPVFFSEPSRRTSRKIPHFPSDLSAIIFFL